MAATRTKEAFAEFRLMWDGGDPWGSTMSWWFTIADELYHRTGSTPPEWHFRPSPLGPSNDPEAYETEVCEGLDDETLIRFGTALGRYASKLKAAGMSY